ncbi:ubiquitin carboxyl-terminal hydrolase 17-like protein 6 [Strix aluco]|uniref:ubiquitin carboxyl-terminal hydrolase 17-like protein 6 n=1 Tax=Strix aluco TaxID=111821 RepID=UPI003DA471DF
MLSCNSLVSSPFKCHFPAVVGEGMTPPQRILFPPEKICTEWQQRQRAGAGLHNMGNTCFLNSVLQCLTYTPPLANYLLSREHSQSCRQQGFCMMCRMERHVNEVLQSSGSAIQPWAIVSVLTRIGEHFKLGMQEDAHEFLRCTVAAMQEACLSGSSNLDMASQSTTVVHQIFAGFLRSRVTCLRCNTVSDYYEAFLDVPLHIKVRGFVTTLRDVPSPCIFPESMRLTLRAASSVTAALENFVKPEQLDSENCFKCSRCDKMVAASKRFTVHHAPKVFTVFLNRCEDFTSRKISKVCTQPERNFLFLEEISQGSQCALSQAVRFVEYPEYLDLRPYMSQTAGEPLLYSLYAVLVHQGASCLAGHYYCYTKASNGLWYVMNDNSVDRCDIDTVLRQQAYLLFYVRCSKSQLGQRAYSSPTPSYAPSFLSRSTANHKQDTALGLEESPQGSGSSTPAGTSLLVSRRLVSRREAVSRGCSQPFDPVLHAVPQDSNKEEHRFRPPSPCQRNSERERARCRSPLRNSDLGSRGHAAPWPANSSSLLAPTRRAAWERAPPRQNERSRSPRRGHDLRSRFVDYTELHRALRRTSRGTTIPPSCASAPRGHAVPGPANSSSLREEEEVKGLPR